MADEVSWKHIWHVRAPTESVIPCGSYLGKQDKEIVHHFFNHNEVPQNRVFFGFSYPSYEPLCLFWEFINLFNFRIWLLSLFPLLEKGFICVLIVFRLCPLLDSYEINSIIIKLNL